DADGILLTLRTPRARFISRSKRRPPSREPTERRLGTQRGRVRIGPRRRRLRKKGGGLSTDRGGLHHAGRRAPRARHHDLAVAYRTRRTARSRLPSQRSDRDHAPFATDAPARKYGGARRDVRWHRP